MQSRRLLLLFVLCLAVGGLGAAALYLGPPRPPPAPQPPTAPVAVADPPNWAGGTVRSFGPVPQCGDEAATAAVLGLLRAKVADRTLGLANVHVAGHSQIGDLEAWACEADVQVGGGERRIRYQVNQLTAGRELWEVTVSAPSEPGAAR